MYDPEEFVQFLKQMRLHAAAAYQSPLEWGPGVEVAITAMRKWTVVAFAGTNVLDLRDIRKDCSVSLVSTVHGKVHQGFHETAVDFLTELDGIGGDLVLTGHSLGGAYALHAAKLLNSDRIKAIVTFGQPAVGDASYVRAAHDALGHKMIRVVNGLDRVPRLWTTRVMGYRQTRPFFYIDIDNQLHYNPGRVKVWKDFLKRRLDKTKPFDGLTDHFLSSYRIESYHRPSFRLPELMGV